MEDNKSTRITFGCMSYIFFCVTNLLFEKYNGVGHQKFMVNLVMNFLTM